MSAIRAATRKRPFGVMIIIIINLLTAILIVTTFAFNTEIPPALYPTFERIFGDTDVVRIVLVAGQLVIIAGLWFLKRWAWVVLMIRLGMSMFFNLREHFWGSPDVDYLLMLMDVIAVFYMNQREVQRAFGYEDPNAREELIA